MALGALVAGCAAPVSDVGGGPIDIGDANGWVQPIEEPADDCSAPGWGCPCAPGQGPIGCFLEPSSDDLGRRICTGGSRSCRDGEWTACESLASWILRTETALIDGPEECNACDPACGTSTDAPGPGDVTPSNSDDVEYDATVPGVTLEDLGTSIDTLPDMDGDGVPDVYDSFPADPTRDGFTEAGGLFQVVPFGDTAGPDSLTLNTTLQTADVYFIIDNTGSMGDEIANVRASLTAGEFIPGCTGGIVGAINCIIPDAWIGIGRHGEYAVRPYGDNNDQVYTHVLDITPDIAAAQTAINTVTTNGNIDWPESQTQAIHSAVTGLGLGGYYASRTGCPAGTWGYPCFRDDAIPIIVLITDAPFHNGPNTSYDYDAEDFFTNPASQPWVGNSNRTQGTRISLGDVTGRWVGARGTTNSANNDYDFGCGASGNDVVFEFTLSASQTTTISLDNSSFDTVLTVFNADTGAGWCNNNFGDNRSRLVRNLPAGRYLVFVDGRNGARGNYRLGVGDPCVVSTNCFSPPTWTETVDALNARNVRTIAVESSEGFSDALASATALANATGSADSSGTPFVFSIDEDGTGLDATVVEAVSELANFSRLDVTARADDNPATPGIDERLFVDTLTATSFPPGRCDGIASDGLTFENCLPGSDVVFDATFRNDIVMPTAAIQQFDFTISIHGDGTSVLDTVPVRILVPPERRNFAPTGRYWRDYDSTLHCASNERPDWGALDWNVTIEPGTEITFELRASDDLATLAGVSPVRVTVPSATPPIDIGDTLVAAGGANFLPYLRVTAVLTSNADASASPTLTGFTQRFTCTPTE